MSFYRRHLFPYVMDWVMSASDVLSLRRESLSSAYGNVLEIGFGTGLNLKAYPQSIESVVGLDIDDPHSLTLKRIRKSNIHVDLVKGSAEEIPFNDDSFDTVVSTFTLCSIPNPEKAVKEFYRVLKPQGVFIFLEHGLSSDPKVSEKQHSPGFLHKYLGEGCSLNRPISSIVERAFDIEECSSFHMPGRKRALAHVYQGVARK